MVEIIRGRDPQLEAIKYLSVWFPDIRVEVPSGWTGDGLLVVVQDAGGSGGYDIVLDDVLLRFLVFHPDQETASSNARTLHGLVKRWGEEHAGVSFRDLIQRPTYDPDPDTGVPAYTMTVRLVFRAETVTVTP